MLIKQQSEAFKQFADTMNKKGVLDEKTVYLVRMAAAIALGCYPCMEHMFGSIRENGVTEEEMGSVLAVVMFVAAGAARNKALEVYDTRVAGLSGQEA